MGNNPSFFQCHKTSKALFNPKVGQNSSLNIHKKLKSSFDSNKNMQSSITMQESDGTTISNFSSSSSTTFSATKCLDNYVIEKKISEGGSLMLMRCKKDRDKLSVLKIIKKQALNIINDENYLQYIKSLKNCPYVVNIFHSFYSQNNLYLIMEYCSGDLFIEMLKKQRRFSEDVARFYMAQLILALEILENSWSQRRLAVDNLLLDQDGHLKVTNFGGDSNFLEDSPCEEISEEELKEPFSKYSRLEDYFNQNLLNTTDRDILHFLAPELIEKKGLFDVRSSDLWTIGVLLFQMVTGNLPFLLTQREKSNQNQAGNIENFIKIVKENEPIFPKYMSPECKDLINELLRKEPSERIGTRNWKEIKDHVFFEKYPWKQLQKKLIPSPYLEGMQANNLAKKDEFKRFWIINEGLCKKQTVYLERTYFIGKEM